MQYHKVELCGVNTAKLPVLKEKEKAALLRAVRNGDAEARQKMINGNLRLVLSVVQKFSGRGENLDDLFQVGCIGLTRLCRHANSCKKSWAGTQPRSRLPSVSGCPSAR